MSGDSDEPRGFDSLDWKSFWDLATPEQAANVLRELYGESAADEAAGCSAAALANNRLEDHHFWTAVRAALCPHTPSPNSPTTTWRH